MAQMLNFANKMQLKLFPKHNLTASFFVQNLNKLVCFSTSSRHGQVQEHQSMYFSDTIDPEESKFKKILIANRGEIACRVIKTCKKMGIKTVAVHSDIDSMALHVRMADEAHCLGGAPLKQSYLNMDAILNVIKKTGADAVHPGYGFFSENNEFAQKLADEGVTFIGPNSASIHAMGDKIESKKIAKEAGVHTIPGFEGIVENSEQCEKLAKEIGYPVIIKASAGGGGKGMRIAWNDQEAREGFRFSSQEATAFFGDNRLLIEKYLDKSRHIEIQVLCDKHKNAVHLNERECSIQRRNQKVIEEAPSTFVNPELRKEMGAQAVQLALAVGYDSAGTVEFLVDARTGNFYFLEMNTRLQVEHPITEFITGIDLVHQMIRVAHGHNLKFKQEDIPLKGWAIESRVYAEDPYKNFGLPSIGRLIKYNEPLNIPNVRCDSGIKEGSEISIYYDPLICKLVTYGKDRQEALETTASALDMYVIRGVTHNIPLLRDVITEENFVSGNLDTKYLYKTYPDGFEGRVLNDEQKSQLSAIAASLYVRDNERANNFLNTVSIDNPLKSSTYQKNWTLLIEIGENKKRLPLQVKVDDGNYHIKVNEKKFVIPKKFSLAADILEFKLEEKPQIVQLISLDGSGKMKIQFEGTIFHVHVMTEQIAKFLSLIPERPKVDVSKQIKAPMPGLVKSVNCKPGDLVSEGQEICVLEAMKMQNSFSAASSGKVKTVNCKPGDTVEEDQILVELE